MIRNRTDFYFKYLPSQPSSSDVPRIIAVVDAWLSCPVKIHHEGFRLMMTLSRCRGFCNQYVTQASAQIERYLKTIIKHNRDLERSWRRDPVNPQPGPVLVAEFHQPTLDEDGVPATTVPGSSAAGPIVTVPCASPQGVTTATTDEGILDLVRLHYQQMHAVLSSDPRAHADDIARAACLSLLEIESPVIAPSNEGGAEASTPSDSPSQTAAQDSPVTVFNSSAVDAKPTRRRTRRKDNL